MNCERARALILALPSREWTASEAQEVERHTQTCASCSRLLEREQAVEAGVRELPESAPSPELKLEIMARVRTSRPQHALRPSRKVRVVAQMAQAIGVATAIGTYVFHALEAGSAFEIVGFKVGALGQSGALLIGLAGILYLIGVFAPYSASMRSDSKATR